MPLTLRSGRVVGADPMISRRSASPSVDDLLSDPLARPFSGERILTRRVSDKLLGQIRKGDAAIEASRALTPDGAGNQLSEIRASGGISAGRARYARTGWYFTTYQVAKGAAQAGGAHCGEYSAMTYCDLIAQGVEGPVRRGHMTDLDHAFTMIGDDREPGDPVVVDAWVTRPQAHLWKHSEWNNPRAYGRFEVVDTWNTSTPYPSWSLAHIQPEPFTESQARKYLNAPSDVEDLGEWVEADGDRYGWVWDQPYATDKGVYYDYR